MSRISLAKNYDYNCELIIIGDSTVGKSSILSIYNNNTNPLKQISTIGIDYIIKDEKINDKLVKVKIWDTSGQERFKSLADNVLKTSHGVILVFDLNNKETYDNLKTWIQFITIKISENIPLLLIGNKSDLEANILYGESIKFADKFNMKYFETSVKNNTNILESINWLVTQTIEKGIIKLIDKNINK